MPPVRRIPLAVALLLLAATAARGATDGAIGAESEATAEVSFVKQNAVRISGVDDIDLGSRSHLRTSERVVDRLCVYSSTGAYAITATSANGAFELASDDVPGTIPYRLQWISGSVRDLEPGVPVGGLVGHDSDIDCRGRTNASFRVIVTPRDFNAADPGVYGDTLMLVVMPE